MSRSYEHDDLHERAPAHTGVLQYLGVWHSPKIRMNEALAKEFMEYQLRYLFTKNISKNRTSENRKR